MATQVGYLVLRKIGSALFDWDYALQMAPGIWYRDRTKFFFAYATREQAQRDADIFNADRPKRAKYEYVVCGVELDDVRGSRVVSEDCEIIRCAEVRLV